MRMRSLCVAVFCIVSFVTLPQATAGPIEAVWDIFGRQRVSLEEALAPLDAGLAYVGEHHDNAVHHDAQVQVIRTLHAQGKNVAVGLEMLQHADQQALDRWVSGDIDERAMRRIFARNWSDDWVLYADIFRYCRDNGIPMIGLNVDRAITRKVYRQGFASLTDEELGNLPPIVCDVSPDYRAFLEAVLGGHAEDEAFDFFCEAQLVWDTSMAVYATEHLAAHPGTVMVVVTGMVHAWKMAMPRRAAERLPGVNQLIFQPRIPGRWDEEATTVRDADYLMYITE